MTATTQSRWYSQEMRTREAEFTQQGRITEAIDALLAVLDARGFDLPDQTRERITATTDLDTLTRWHRQAVTAPSVDDALT